jgi:protoheme IX farnesyltransferase
MITPEGTLVTSLDVNGTPLQHVKHQDHIIQESTFLDYISLMKPGVMGLVVYSALCGMVIAPIATHPLMMLMSIICIAMGSGAAAVFNMWYDRDIDKIMSRTCHRPVACGRILPENALVFGWILTLFSVAFLGLTANWYAAFSLAFSIGFYSIFYTMYLKRRTPQNIVIGGAAGAFPPVIGWYSVTLEASWEPWILFLIIFLWTPPHFWALALYRSEDYQKAGIPMLPVTHGLQKTKLHIFLYTIALIVSSFLWSFKAGGYLYHISAILLGGTFLGLSWRLFRSPSPRLSMMVFFYSMIYLFALITAIILDHFLRTLL